MTDTFRRFQRIHSDLGDLIGHLIRCQGLAGTAYTAATVTLPDGYPSGHAEPVSGGSVSNPTLGTVMARMDTLDGSRYNQADDELVASGAAAVEQSIKVMRAAVDEVKIELGRIIGPSLATDPTIGSQPGSGYCRACRTWVTGLKEDRLRTGLCPKDYQRWVRAERPDMIGFIRLVQLDRGIIGEHDKPKIPDLDT